MGMDLAVGPQHHRLPRLFAAEQFLRGPIVRLFENRTVSDRELIPHFIEHQVFEFDVEPQLTFQVVHLHRLTHLLLHKFLRVLPECFEHPPEIINVIVGEIELCGGEQTRLHMASGQSDDGPLALSVDQNDAVPHPQCEFAFIGLVLFPLDDGADPLQFIEVPFVDGLFEQVLRRRIDSALDVAVEQLLGLRRERGLDVIAFARSDRPRQSLVKQLRFVQRRRVCINQLLQRLVHFPFFLNYVPLQLQHPVLHRSVKQHRFALADVFHVEL